MKKLFILMLAFVFVPACFAQGTLPADGNKTSSSSLSSVLNRLVYTKQKPFTQLKLGDSTLEQEVLTSLKEKHPKAEVVAGLGEIFYERTVSCDIESVTYRSFYVLVKESGVNHYYQLDVVGPDWKTPQLRLLRHLNQTQNASILSASAYVQMESEQVVKLEERARKVYAPLANNLIAVAALYPLSLVENFENVYVVSSRKLPGDYDVNVDTVAITIVLRDGTKKEHYFEVYPPRSLNIMDTILNPRMVVAKNDPAADIASPKNDSAVAAKQQEVLQEFNAFAKFASRQHYYNYNFLFQAMDGLRETYMELRAMSPKAAREIAPEINKPVTLVDENVLYVEKYLRMETCTLYESEQVKFDAFGHALEEDLK